MAALAGRSEAAAMLVVRNVAAHAARGERCARGRRHLVASLAGRLLVFAGERIVRLRIVIEAPAIPADGIVASRTVLAETTTMHIILAVAGSAIAGRVEIGRCRVAFLASNISVLAQQREVRKVMIEANIHGPVLLAVTLAAPITQLTLVRVVVTMASDAANGGGFYLDRLLVAACALDVQMGPIEREIRIATVLEADARPTAFGMAVGAGGA